MIVLPEIRLAALAAMKIALDELVDDQILEERTLQVMQVDLVLIANAKQGTGHARIVKIEFGRFDQPLVEIAVERL